MYLIAKAVTKIIVYSFFREITILNYERVPLYGPVIFVGNHNNQFVDASMLMAMLPRRVRFLIADKSLKRPIIGCLAQAAGSIGVARPQDKIYGGLGLIFWEEGSSTIKGIGTRFLLDLRSGDKIKVLEGEILVLVKDIISDYEIIIDGQLPAMPFPTPSSPLSETSSPSSTNMSQSSHLTLVSERLNSTNQSSSTDIEECNAEEFQLEKSIKLPLLSVENKKFSECDLLGTALPFMVIPRVDQSDVYEAVTDALVRGDSIGIFPEGGSHDRLELLPLKPGVAIMALTAALEGAEDVMIVPIGLTYYQAHKILSRATIQIGSPLIVPDDLVQLFRTDSRASVANLMKMIEENLKSCIVSAPSYTALTAVRLCVTLYAPESMYLPSDKYHILYHQFSVLFAKNQHHEQVIEFTKNVKNYAALLSSYGIADHEVRQLKQTAEGAFFSFLELICIFLVAVVIGLAPAILWGPIRLASSYLAEQHRKVALAESKVKITGRDVVASYKILTLMVLVPSANLIYSAIFGFCYCSTWLGVIISILTGLILLPCIYYYSVRYFAKISVLLRKFRFIMLVLVCKLNAWRDNEKEIITCRMQMQLGVRQLVHDLGPQTSDNFMSQMERCVPDVVCSADSNRIRRKLHTGDFFPLSSRRFLEGREEIL